VTTKASRQIVRSVIWPLGSLQFLSTSRDFPEDPEKASQVDVLLTALVTRYGQQLVLFRS
jgi:hypothetical protein